MKYLPFPAYSLSLMAVSMASFGIPMLKHLATEGELMAALTSRFCSEVRLLESDADRFTKLLPWDVSGPPLTPNSC